MADLKGVPGELRCTITIKRAATGKEETFDVVGHSDPEKLKTHHGTTGNMVGQGSSISNQSKE